MKLAAILSLAASAVLASVEASETSVLFDAALTNGTAWTYRNVRLYADKPRNVYFNAAEGEVRSPRFTNALVAVSLTCGFSGNKTKRPITLIPVVDGEETPARALWVPVSDGSGVVVSSFAWNVTNRIEGFVIRSGTGEGNFSLVSANLAFDDTPLIARPDSLFVDRIYRNCFRANWRSPDAAVSNLVVASQIEERAFHADYTHAYDFSRISNESVQPYNISDALYVLLPGFSGDRIFAAASSEGTIQISTRDQASALVHRGLEDYAGRSVVFRARRFPSEDEGSVMPVSWITNEVSTSLATVTLGDEEATYAVSLDGVPGGASIALGSTIDRVTASRSNGRVLLTSYAYAVNVTEAAVLTNVVFSRFTTGNSCFVRRLRHNSETFWKVRSYGEGVPSTFSETCLTVTNDEQAPGFSVWFR